MEKIKNVGYGICLLFALSLFLSEKFENNVLIPLLLVLFLISIIFSKNRENSFVFREKKISVAVFLLAFSPFIIAFLDGGLHSRWDNYNFKYLSFFPLIYFLDEDKKMFNFIKALLVGGTITLIIAIFNFVKDFDAWAHPVGFYYPRVTAILTVQDFANMMCIILLFLFSFILFYKNKDGKKNKIIKVILIILAVLFAFIVVVNRSKMVYISLLPTIFYLVFKKNKKYVAALAAICVCGFFLFPTSISSRLEYIVQYRKDPSSNLRMIFWKTGVAAFSKKPIYGWKSLERKQFNLDYYKKTGTMDYVNQYFLSGPNIRPQHYVASHNSYLQYLLDFGILGFVFFAFLFIEIMIIFFKTKFFKSKKNFNSKFLAFEMATKVSLVAWLIQGMTDDNLNDKHMILTLTILIVFMCYLYQKCEILKNNEK